MSANNEIFLTKKRSLYCVYHRDVDQSGHGDLIGKTKDIKEALKIAKSFIKQAEYGVEYGIRIDNSVLTD